jgi:hypothetical protein
VHARAGGRPAQNVSTLFTVKGTQVSFKGHPAVLLRLRTDRPVLGRRIRAGRQRQRSDRCRRDVLPGHSLGRKASNGLVAHIVAPEPTHILTRPGRGGGNRA